MVYRGNEAAREQAMSSARRRIADRPDIYAVLSVRGQQGKSISEGVKTRIIDLNQFVPALTLQQIGMLCGVSQMTVHNVLSDEDDLDLDSGTVFQCEAERIALKREHPGCRYQDHPAAAAERIRGLPYRAREIYVPLP